MSAPQGDGPPRVLLIAHAFPPYPASGARRAFNVASALAREGHPVRVITARADAGAREPAPGVEVTGVSSLPAGSDVLNLLQRAGAQARGLLAAAPGPNAAGAAGRADPGRLEAPDILDPGPPLRRWLASTLRFPDPHAGFLLPAARAALDPSTPRAHVLYTSGPPVTVHLAGLLVQACTGLPWVAEFRDPWIVDGEPYRAPALRALVPDRLEAWLYARCLAAAREVVAVTRGIASLVAPARAALGRPSPHVARNGIPALPAPSDRAPTEKPLRILHLGNLYAFRDPRPFFDGIAALKTARRWTAADVRVEFVGVAPEPGIREYVRARGIEDLVRFTGWVDHDTGQALVRSAHFLLLLAQRQPLQVPNKLYEYLGSGNPILAFADRAGETASLLRRVPGHTLIVEDDGPDAVREALARALDAPPPSLDAKSRAVLAAWTTARQLAVIPEIVRRAAGSGGGALPHRFGASGRPQQGGQDGDVRQ